MVMQLMNVTLEEGYTENAALFFVSAYAILALFLDSPVFLALRLQAKAFLAGSVEFSVVRHVAIEGFKVGLPLFESFDVLVHFAFDVV